MPQTGYLREIIPRQASDLPPPSRQHLHPCKHTVLFFSASDSTQPWLFLFLRLIAPTEHHWFYGKPCLQAECHRPEVTFCLPQPRRSWTFKSTLRHVIRTTQTEKIVKITLLMKKNILHEVWFWEVILKFPLVFPWMCFHFCSIGSARLLY